MYTKKLIRRIGIFLAVGIIMSGCSKTSETSEAAPLQTEQAETESQTTSEIIETTKIVPTGFEDYVDETIPNNKISLNNVDMNDFIVKQINFGGVGMGYGNTKLLSFVRSYFSDNSLNTVDIPYYESPGHNYDDVLSGFQESVDIDFIRYVLEENGLRFWIDEIPTEFFREKFPDYYDLVNKGDNSYIIIEDEIFNYFVRNGSMNGYNGSLADFYSSGGNREKTTQACLIQLMYYNQDREKIVANMPDNDDHTTKYGCIKTGLTPDGKYVWCLTKLQYRVVQNDTKRLPKCENIDILIPETRDDLIASGVDVEKYDEMCKKLFGGAKMSES